MEAQGDFGLFEAFKGILEQETMLPPKILLITIDLVDSLVFLADKVQCDEALVAFE